MEIGHVVTACNDHPMYLDLIRPFVRAWRGLYPDVVLHIIIILPDADYRLPRSIQALVASLTETSSTHIRFVPIIAPSPVSTQFASQFVRVLYPGMLEPCDKAVLTTDIDMVPMNSSFFRAARFFGSPVPPDSFVVFRPPTDNQVYICYCAALPQTWRQVTGGIDSWQALLDKMRHVYLEIRKEDRDVHGGPGWYADQNELYSMVMSWDCRRDPAASPSSPPIFKTRLVILSDHSTGHRRLDRCHWQKDKEGRFVGPDEHLSRAIASGVFTDYHMDRPYETHCHIVDRVISLTRK
jgi:hypothetical protein